MARDVALEAWLREALRGETNVTETAMFGGKAWLLSGHLLCGAREDGMLARVGPARNAWALAFPAVAPMVMRGRALDGWVRAAPEAGAEPRRQLLDAALAFARSLPAKDAGHPKRNAKAKPERRTTARR